ncbi:M23 family metallopeptidase [Pseudactinotalea sp.]|uniref:M23 family metallopeptidase n=1 Tax=Pseudactinotalea sp. TaxID=1926260 RepID=UPI003B3B0C2F
MSEEHESAAPVLPTRRALREAERREAARLRKGAPAATVPTEATPAVVATLEIPAEDKAAVAAAAAELAHKGRPTASEPMRRRRTSTTATSRRASLTRTWLPRVAVLGSLAIATTAVPLSGVTSPSSTGPTAAATFAASSALDVLGAEQVDGTDAFDAGNAFAADPLAGARTVLSTGRTDGREDVLQCGSAQLEANGQVSAGATTEPVQIMMPLQTGVYNITSRYGYRWGGMHEGLDMAAPAGTPIHAVAAGEVTFVGFGLGGRSGMIIVLKHEVNGEQFWTWYIHMYPGGVFVDVGQRVAAGEVIGEVGSYGNSTGPHLHLEVHVDSEFTTVDPAPWLESHNAAALTSENLACAATE